MYKKVSTLGGTMFIIWFCFSMIVGLLSLADDSIFSSILLEILGSGVIALISFSLMKLFGLQFFIKENIVQPQYPDDVLVKKEISFIESLIVPILGTSVVAVFLLMNYLQEGMVVSAIGVVSGMPIFFLITGAAIFSIVCLANWHKEFHKKVNFYLSGGYVNEESAAARAEETLQFLSGALIFLSGIIIFLVFV